MFTQIIFKVTAINTNGSASILHYQRYNFRHSFLLRSLISIDFYFCRTHHLLRLLSEHFNTFCSYSYSVSSNTVFPLIVALGA